MERLLYGIKYSYLIQIIFNRSIWTLVCTLKSTTPPSGSESNKSVLHIPQISRTEVLLRCSLVSFPGHSFTAGVGLTLWWGIVDVFLRMETAYSTLIMMKDRRLGNTHSQGLAVVYSQGHLVVFSQDHLVVRSRDYLVVHLQDHLVINSQNHLVVHSQDYLAVHSNCHLAIHSQGHQFVFSLGYRVVHLLGYRVGHLQGHLVVPLHGNVVGHSHGHQSVF